MKNFHGIKVILKILKGNLTCKYILFCGLLRKGYKFIKVIFKIKKFYFLRLILPNYF